MITAVSLISALLYLPFVNEPLFGDDAVRGLCLPDRDDAACAEGGRTGARSSDHVP